MTDEPDEPEVVSGTVIPDIGNDATPTLDMVLKGRVGNGFASQITTAAAEVIQKERRASKELAKLGRREAYEEGVKDALGAVARLEGGILSIGEALMQRIERGEALNGNELATLRLAQKTSEDIKNRAMGRPKTTAEVTTQSSILHLIAGLDIE